MFLGQKSFLFWYILKYNLFLWCAAEVSASLLHSSVSRDLSEIILIWWFAAQETFIIIISVESGVLLNIFVETDTFFMILKKKSFKVKLQQYNFFVLKYLM